MSTSFEVSAPESLPLRHVSYPARGHGQLAHYTEATTAPEANQPWKGCVFGFKETTDDHYVFDIAGGTARSHREILDGTGRDQEAFLSVNGRSSYLRLETDTSDGTNEDTLRAEVILLSGEPTEATLQFGIALLQAGLQSPDLKNHRLSTLQVKIFSSDGHNYWKIGQDDQAGTTAFPIDAVHYRL